MRADRRTHGSIGRPRWARRCLGDEPASSGDTQERFGVAVDRPLRRIPR